MWQKIKNIYHLGTAIIANIVYRFPGRKLIVIGVTGTDGKTTTVSLIYHILKTARKSVSMVSTVGTNIHGKETRLGFHVTTPRFFELQRFLSKAVKRNEKENYVVLEVSSHAIDQFRVWGIPFAIGVLTNVTNEHLDYHKTYDNYLKTKAKLLRNSSTVVVNADDGSYPKLLPLIENKKTVTYGIYAKADIVSEKYPYASQLIGEFNTYNMLAAISVCKTLGIPDAVIKKGIETFQTPVGRMNEIQNNLGVTIIVDYAHTPNGLYQALTSLQSRKKDTSHLISLIGAEGYRDSGKRPLLGEIATKLSDIVIITGVDPRGQEIEINRQILEGAQKAGGILDKTVFIQPDREKAITMAITKLSRKGDIIGIFGKGHERSINYDGMHEEQWNDTETVMKILSAR